MTQRRFSRTLGVLSFVLGGVIWELVGLGTKNSLVWVPLSAIVVAGINLAKSGELGLDVVTSLTEFALGFGLAVVVGITIGSVMAAHRVAHDVLEPWMAALFTVPIIALGPLFIVWWGIGLQAKVIIIALVGVFPIVLNTSGGLEQVDPQLIEAVRSFGATPFEIYRKVRWPAALPSVLTGIRISLRGCLVAVVVAELFGSSSGLGWLVLNSAQSFQTADLFVGVLALSALGVIGFQLIGLVERVLIPWRAGLRS